MRPFHGIFEKYLVKVNICNFHTLSLTYTRTLNEYQMQIIRKNALFLVRHERPFCKSVINLHFLLFFFTFLVIWKNLLSSVSTQTWPSQQCSLAEHVFPLQGSWASASNSSSNNSAKLFIWKAKSSKFIRNEYLVPNRRLSEKLEVWTRNFLPHWFYVKSICHIWGPRP